MAYIQVPDGVPGIRSLVMFRPETGKHLYDLAQILLRGEAPLTEAERELIAWYERQIDTILDKITPDRLPDLVAIAKAPMAPAVVAALPVRKCFDSRGCFIACASCPALYTPHIPDLLPF